MDRRQGAVPRHVHAGERHPIRSATPEYMVGTAPMGPTGPINSSRVQIHLPNGSEVLQADVDGEPVDHGSFASKGGPPSCSTWNVAPRDEDRDKAFLLEPDSQLQRWQQPLIRDQQTVILDMDC